MSQCLRISRVNRIFKTNYLSSGFNGQSNGTTAHDAAAHAATSIAAAIHAAGQCM